MALIANRCPKTGRGAKLRRRAFCGTIALGVGSICWFLVRVVPKPSRASYPCQRAARRVDPGVARRRHEPAGAGRPSSSVQRPWVALALCAALACTERHDATHGDSGGATSSPQPTVPVNPDYTVSYYRLRIEFLDHGDWATLHVVDPSKIVKVREMSRAGAPNVLVIDRTQLALNTALGHDLSVVADFALLPAAVTSPFELALEKGVAGTVTLRASMVLGDRVTLLDQRTLAQGIDYTLDLTPFLRSDPVKAPVAPVKNLGLALYYPWYSLDTWKNNPALHDTPLFPYASDDPAALARQMDQAQSAGIGAFVVSWIGPGSQSDQNLKLLLAQAQPKGFKIGFFLETTGGDLAQHPNVAAAWLSYIASEYSGNPAVLAVDGRPVVVPWVTNTIPAATWASIRAAAVGAAGKDVWLVQDCQEMDYLAVFDGVWYSGDIDGLGEKVRYYSVLADDPAPKLWIATAMPGFDERLLADRTNPRYIDRAGSAYFRAGLDHAFANSPQWVAVYTWNEWFEETYIEPSAAYGTQYLDIAGGYLKGWVQP
jgi:hypothetical protein